MLLNLLLVNATALAGVLLMSRYSVMREAPVGDDAWVERLVGGRWSSRVVQPARIHTP